MQTPTLDLSSTCSMIHRSSWKSPPTVKPCNRKYTNIINHYFTATHMASLIKMCQNSLYICHEKKTTLRVSSIHFYKVYYTFSKSIGEFSTWQHIFSRTQITSFVWRWARLMPSAMSLQHSTRLSFPSVEPVEYVCYNNTVPVQLHKDDTWFRATDRQNMK